MTTLSLEKSLEPFFGKGNHSKFGAFMTSIYGKSSIKSSILNDSVYESTQVPNSDKLQSIYVKAAFSDFVVHTALIHSKIDSSNKYLKDVLYALINSEYRVSVSKKIQNVTLEHEVNLFIQSVNVAVTNYLKQKYIVVGEKLKQKYTVANDINLQLSDMPRSITSNITAEPTDVNRDKTLLSVKDYIYSYLVQNLHKHIENYYITGDNEDVRSFISNVFEQWDNLDQTSQHVYNDYVKLFYLNNDKWEEVDNASEFMSKYTEDYNKLRINFNKSIGSILVDRIFPEVKMNVNGIK